MSDIELAIKRTKKLEELLEVNYGAAGRGLHEKVTSVEAQLAPETVKTLRYVATLRNKLVHDSHYDRLDNRDSFIAACDRAERALQRAPAGGGAPRCFVATAVYGSSEAPQVMVLRRYRDAVLLRHRAGRAFVRLYYAVSPGLARRLRDVSPVRRLLRRGLDAIVAHIERGSAA